MRRVACLLTCVLIAGCQPAAVYRLTSREPDVRWLRGQQLIRREADGVLLVASFNRTWGEYLVFDVAIANRSDSTILIEPEKFHYALAVTHGGERTELDRRIAAVDPEEELGHLDKQASAEQARYETTSMLDAFTGFADVVSDLAAAESRTEAEEDRDARRDYERGSESNQEDQKHESTQANLAELRDYWASRALRTTHLGPRRTIGGKIVLPGRAVTDLMDETPGDRAWSLARSRGPADYTLILHCPAGTVTHEMEFVVERL